MKNLDQISMMIISYSGIVRSLCIELIDLAEEGKSTQDTIVEIEENLKNAQKEHFNVLTLSSKENINLSILFLHAEDQMMAAETLYIVAKKFIRVYQKINEE